MALNRLSASKEELDQLADYHELTVRCISAMQLTRAEWVKAADDGDGLREDVERGIYLELVSRQFDTELQTRALMRVIVKRRQGL